MYVRVMASGVKVLRDADGRVLLECPDCGSVWERAKSGFYNVRRCPDCQRRVERERALNEALKRAEREGRQIVRRCDDVSRVPTPEELTARIFSDFLHRDRSAAREIDELGGAQKG